MRSVDLTMTASRAKSDTILGFCGVCARDIAVQKGQFVHHGYKRPGHGFIEGDCLLVAKAPYQTSPAPLEPYVAMLKKSLETHVASLAEVESGARRVFIRVTNHWNRPATIEEFSLDVEAQKYDATREREYLISNLTRLIDGLRREIARVEKLIADWRPGLKLGSRSKPQPKDAACAGGLTARKVGNTWKLFRDEKRVGAEHGYRTKREAQTAAYRMQNQQQHEAQLRALAGESS